MLGMGVGVGWFTFLALRRGYFDEGERFVYADQEPGGSTRPPPSLPRWGWAAR
jgi:hypothetical protein